jgi:PadR family transcriptional regulator PadR
MADSRPLSFTAACVLRSIADGTPYGFDIMDATGLPSGTVYPILARMEHAELVRSRWESVAAARREKRPPRRYYEVTAAGKRALAAATEHYRTRVGQLVPSWKGGSRG